MQPSISFGSWLKQRRKALDLSREELAARVGCGVSTIGKLEINARRPSRQIAERLADSLELPPEQRAAFVQLARAVAPDALSFTQAPALPAETPRPLPVPLTPLVGRAEEAAEVCTRLAAEDVRLLTLLGPPGVGKTRLALQVAADVRDEYADGVCWVALAPLRDPSLVAAAVAQALGVVEAGEQPLEERLSQYLHTKHCLLLLDNVEQVVDAAPLVATLLAQAPRLTVLSTSRVPLHIYGEYEYAVPPLGLPDAADLSAPDRLAGADSVRLFVARAQAVNHRFALTPENARAVADICIRLDGLPLAIELAAARVKLFAPDALLEHLERPLAVLTGGPRDREPRQRTLRAAIDWSYELLDRDEQAVLRRLGVFVGGWTTEAAEAVTAVGTEQEAVSHAAHSERLLDSLAALLDNSLIVPGEREQRWTMLELIREYALERLDERGELAAVRRQHAAYYVALAERARPELEARHQAAWFERLELEHPNLRAALAWTLTAAGDPRLGLRLAGALGRFWWNRNHWSEGRAWFARVLGHGEARTTERALALVELARLHFNVDADQALRYARESERLYRELGHPLGVADALMAVGRCVHLKGHVEQAAARFEESLLLHRAANERRGMAICLGWLGRLAAERGDYRGAYDRLKHSLPLAEEGGNTWIAHFIYSSLGDLARATGDDERAAAQYTHALTLARELGSKHEMAVALFYLGSLALQHGNEQQAAACFGESVMLDVELGSRRGIAYGLSGIAGVLTEREQFVPAARVCAAAEGLFATVGAQMEPLDQAQHDRTRAHIHARLDDHACAAAWAEGRAMTLEQAVAYALDACGDAPA